MAMDWGSDFVGIVLLAFGAVLAFWLRKRKFDRTNEFGIEIYASYWGKLGAKTKDGLFGGSAICLISTGLLILAFRHVDSWGWIVVLPVCALMLFVLIGL